MTYPQRRGQPDTTYAAWATDGREHELRTDADGIVRPRNEQEQAVADVVGLELVTNPAEDAMPSRNASKKEWAAYAVSQGMEPDEADAATRAELIERYGDRLPAPTTDDEEES